ncbi:MAG: M55 family metallopeptidase [bacterium]
MKIFISVDLEGVAGCVQWDVADRQRERDLITAEANAAIAGAFEGGAKEVLVTEAHANMRNIIPEKIDPRAIFLSGQPKPLNHMAGIDSSFDAALFVGYHARAGALGGVLAHTYSGSIFSLRFNGIEVGEIGVDAAIAGYFGVPVVMVAGDRAACDEARELLGKETEAVVVKEGVSRYAAKCVPPERAQELIREGANRALKRAERPLPFVVNPPVRGEVTFTDPSFADVVSPLPFVKRLDGRTVAFEGKDFVEAFELFNCIMFFSSAVR